MTTSDRGIDLIKDFEKLKLEAYDDGGGVWTIGYGHTKGVRRGDVCTEQQAKEWLREDVETAEFDVTHHVDKRLCQNEFDALVSLAFNIGGNQFAASSLVKMLNDNDFYLIRSKKNLIYLKKLITKQTIVFAPLLEMIPEHERAIFIEFFRWRYDNGKELYGLARRRNAEASLFLESITQDGKEEETNWA